MRIAIALVAVVGCRSAAQFEDCAVSCAPSGGCPSGFACGTEGYCRLEGAGGTCAGLVPDGGRDAALDPIDAALDLIDAGPQTVTLHQTASNLPVDLNHATCWDEDDTEDTFAQNWYRVFPLADHGITGRPFHVESVKFSIDEADGSPTVEVRVGTYTGAVGAQTLDLAKLSVLASQVTALPNTETNRTISVPIKATIPADGQLAIDIRAPSFIGLTKSVFIGSTTSAETRFAYVRAPECGVAVPTNVSALDPSAHLVITATGWY